MSEDLHQRIRELEEECRKLRVENSQLRKESEIPPSPTPAHTGSQRKQGIHVLSSPEEKIALFRQLFRGRDDVYPVRWENHEGKSGYSPAFDRSKGFVTKENRKLLPLTNQVIRDHLSGKITAGVYAMIPDDMCWFLAADFDKNSWKEDCRAFLASCADLEIPASLECSRSSNGGHVWIFFEEPVTANLARRLGAVILTHTMQSRPELGLDSYDRFFPSQDTIPKGGFGNLIALPLQKKPRQHGGSVFLDENFAPYEDQWNYLSSVQRVSIQQTEEVVQKAGMMGDLLGVRRNFHPDEEIFHPWELKPSETFCTAPLSGSLPASIRIVSSNLHYVEKESLPPSLINRIIRLAAFHNPEFYQAQALRFSTFNKPRLIHCAEDFTQHLALPRGCLQDLKTLCEAHGIEMITEDKRYSGTPIKAAFRGELRDNQKKAQRAVLQHHDGVICAATAFGKTVVAAHLLARRGVNTLIIVHRRQLLDQWRERLVTFLEIDPEEIGQIGGGKNRPTGIIDLAIIQSLNRKGQVKDLVANYGHVIVDECHHLSAISFEQVMRQVKARYVLGLTATPERKDGHHPIIFMQCGPIRYRMTAKAQAKLRPFRYRVLPVFTSMRFDPLLDQPSIHELYQLIMSNESRNKLIAGQVVAALKEGRSPLILTERTEHISILEKLLSPHTQHLLILKGGMGKKQREEVAARLQEIPQTESRIILATGKYIGEGFDDARLDTLFLAMPISWKGTLQQYAGRLHRLHEGKEEVRVYDYIDDESPMFSAMYRRRLKGYANMGYEIHNEDQDVLGFS